MTACPDSLPPSDDKAEAGALACVLAADPEQARAYFAALHADVFYDNRHRTIFAAHAVLHAVGQVLNVVTFYQRLSESGRIEDAGGFDYVQGMPDATHSPAHFPVWLDTLTAFAKRRADLAESARLRLAALKGLPQPASPVSARARGPATMVGWTAVTAIPTRCKKRDGRAKHA
jgi:hypothetical protein